MQLKMKCHACVVQSIGRKYLKNKRIYTDLFILAKLKTLIVKDVKPFYAGWELSKNKLFETF